MKLLVDADYVVYKCCAAAETEVDWGNDVILVTSKFSEAYAAVKRELLKIINNFLWDVVFMPHKTRVSAASAHRTRICAKSQVASLTCQK